MAVHAWNGVLCAFQTLCGALLDSGGGDTTPRHLLDPSRSCAGGRDVWVALSERVRNVIKVS